MNIFLIDYENVNASGFKGIELLSKKDKVYLFYSEKAKNINLDIMDTILKNKISLELFKLNLVDKNALDFQLVFYLGFLARKYKKEPKYYIISNDNGYKSTVNFAKQYIDINIKCFSSIYNAINNILNENIPLLVESIPNSSNSKEAILEPIIPIVNPLLEKRENIEQKLKANSILKSKLVDSQFKQISKILTDETKNTQKLATEWIGKSIGSKKLDLVPIIFNCCREYLQFSMKDGTTTPTILTKNQKRLRVEQKLKSDVFLKDNLIENNFKQISAMLVDDTRNTKNTFKINLLRILGQKKGNLVPSIMERCKEFMRE